MKNIILQHYTGVLGELELKSNENISKYAKFCGADYKLVTGNVFRRYLKPPCQKLIMLDEQFDDYDMVVMIDIDMFTRVGLKDNIFTDTSGIGRHFGIQESLVKNLALKYPLLGDAKYPYWGGSIYRLDLQTRKRLRKHIRDNEMLQFNDSYQDEGIMHRLAVLENMTVDENTYLPDDRWNRSSFEPNVSTANIIHIRKKLVQGGPKYPKLHVYKKMVEMGLIEEG